MNIKTPAQLDLIDRLTRQASQLRAMLYADTSDLSEPLQADYVWACTDLADSIAATAEALACTGLEVQE